MARAPKKPPVDYRAKISAFGWPEIDELWSKIAAVPRKKIVGWAGGMAFENLVLRAFELSGFEVVWPYPVHLEGHVVEQIDGMVLKDGLVCIVEAKDKGHNLNIEPLAKMRNQLLRRPGAVLGGVFSSGGFTEPAKTLAQYMAPQSIMLWQGPEIAHCISNRDFGDPLKWKYRALMQHGKPDYDIRAGAPT